MLRDRVAAHREEFGFWTPDRTWMAFKRTFGPPFRLAFRIRAYGTEHMPPAGPVVLATNHMSAWDPILYGAVLERPIRWMAKAEVFEASPVLEGFLKHGGVFSVRPKSTYLPSAGSNIQCVAPSQIASLAKLSIRFQ